MPVHDWARVDAGIFHSFHHSWISYLSRALNGGLLPEDHYALIERAVPEPEPAPDIVIGPSEGSLHDVFRDPPATRFHLSAEAAAYANKRNRIAIRASSDHHLVAIVEIVSPGNKNNRHGLRAFVGKAVEMLRAGIHLLIIGLFPPSPRDPQGIHKAISDEFIDNDFALPPNQPLTLAAYRAGTWPEAFIQPTAVGLALPEMPLFLTADVYIPLPLEANYQLAWEAVPAFWRNVLQTAAVL
jgi:hypothetical protein